VDSIRHRRLGGGDIIVSEMGLGTQRWGSGDFNAPDEALCHKFMDRAILESGINLIDTAEQYPIPSSREQPEGDTERIIGSWLAKDPSRRSKVVIASKITGGRNVNARNIVADVEGSLRRLGTDYLDVYTLHWPARYTPQSNWGQSLEYKQNIELYSSGRASFEEIAEAMGGLVKAGKIRGWGMCNDNCYGLTASCYAARELGVAPPIVLQNDYSLLNRRIEENGVSEASSPVHENVGFMAYNTLAGGVLTGKYLETPAAVDLTDPAAARRAFEHPRGRMDERGWGYTLYRYRSEAATEATRSYARLAKQYGMPLTELALRWARQRAPVTTQLVGHTSLVQLEEDLRYFRAKEPLPAELMWEVDRVHMRNRLPLFASARVGRDWDGEGEIGEPIP
jgi:aryl-alcohol dehydrogenase-like predicted oxidoreductase